MRSTTRRGYDAEVYVKKLLEKEGFKVLRHPLSRGAADLDAYGNGRVLAVQVKGGKRPYGIGPQARYRLEMYAAAHHAEAWLANKGTDGRWQFRCLTNGTLGEPRRRPWTE